MALNLADSKIAIIGLGYVGLPLAIEFGKKFDVLGFDINESRIKELSEGKDRTNEADLGALNEAVLLKRNNGKSGLAFSSNVEELKNANIFIVTVPTPIDKNIGIL